MKHLSVFIQVCASAIVARDMATFICRNDAMSDRKPGTDN